MRVVLPLRNQNQKEQESSGSVEVASEGAESAASPTRELNTFHPIEHPDSSTAGWPTLHGKRKGQSPPTSPATTGASNPEIQDTECATLPEKKSTSPTLLAVTAPSTLEASTPTKAVCESPSDKPESKAPAKESVGVTGIDRNRKRKSFPGKTTGISSAACLETKPSAAGTESAHCTKKHRQRDTAASEPTTIELASEKTEHSSALTSTAAAHFKETSMVEKKLPDRARHDDYENRYNHNDSFDQDSRESNNDPAEMSMYENDIASAMGEYTQFEAALKQRGLEIKEQEGDGNCLFRAVSLQVYGDASSHPEIRKRCLDFMARDEAHFAQFVTDEPFQDYIGRKRIDGVHGNNPEIQAISELFNRPVEVFVPENGATPLNIFHEEYKTADAPIRLSYHDGNHYNAVVDPLCPTAGLGLGLPGLEPGLADRMQVAKAVEESDKLADEAELEKARKASHDDQVQRAMKESTMSVDQMYKQKAMALSDLEATEIEMEQAALVSSLESYQHGELGRKQSWSSGRRRQGEPAVSSTNNHVAAASGPPSRESAGYASSSVAAAHSHASTSVASASGAYEQHVAPQQTGESPHDEYPQTVQELVMNGFELSKVVHAYELIGDNFDDLLAFLMSSNR